MSNYFSPKRAVLIATSRSGSTFLMNCLDSHPEIGCERYEPMDWIHSPWGDVCQNTTDFLYALWGRPGYKVSMFKLSYRHLEQVGGTEFLAETGAAVIHLWRNNTLRVVVSAAINTAVMQNELNHPVHSFSRSSRPARITLAPEQVLNECRRYVERVNEVRLDLDSSGLNVLELTYGELVGGEGREARFLITSTRDQVCQFLGVDRNATMRSATRRINPQPLADIVENWADIERMIVDSEFAGCLLGERELVDA